METYLQIRIFREMGWALFLKGGFKEGLFDKGCGTLRFVPLQLTVVVETDILHTPRLKLNINYKQ